MADCVQLVVYGWFVIVVLIFVLVACVLCIVLVECLVLLIVVVDSCC